jgi:hypothetical protein
MKRVIRAEPARVISFAPGRDKAMLSRPGRPSRLADAGEVTRVNAIENAPVDHFDNRFLETMRAKGWLRDR